MMSSDDGRQALISACRRCRADGAEDATGIARIGLVLERKSNVG
jgi:hypothetical protein